MIRHSISVCMAAFNGEKFIKEQLDSILSQLTHTNDELIIIDDYSQDKTTDIILSYNSDKIKLFKNKSNIGYIKTFERAIAKAENSIIFLSDQDDIWPDGRLIKMYSLLNDNEDNLLVCSNFRAFNNQGETVCRFKTVLSHSLPEKYSENIKGIFKGNIAYFGCTMAFKTELKKYILPFPVYIDAHDLWIAMVGNVIKKIVHLEDITLLHRIHGTNTSFVKRKFYKKIYTRLLFLRSWYEANKRKSL